MSFCFLGFTIMNGYSQKFCEVKKVMFNHSFNQCNNNDWVLVFEDEFNGTVLDLSTWWLRPCCAGSLSGLEDKTQEYNTLDNVVVENGMIKIFARQDTIVRRAMSYLPDTVILLDGLPNLREYHFTSSNIWSKKEFEFGRVEARIKIPRGKGLRPAFWLYGGDIRWNEIDIFEFFNENTQGVYDPSLLSKVITMTTHDDYDNNGEDNRCITRCTGEDYSEDFHIYTLEWEPNRIAWYVDGTLLREDFRYYSNILGQDAGCFINNSNIYLANKIYPVNPMSIIYNLAIQNGDEGQPDDPTIFPANMYVDWIRYYKRGSNSNVSVTDSTLYPLDSSTYNSIVGNTINISCPYTINQGNQLSAVAASEFVLSPGFYVENGGVFSATIDNNSSSRSTDSTNNLKKKTIEETEMNVSQTDVNIFPTVNQGFFNIEISRDNSYTEVCVVVYDMLGNRILFQSLRGNNAYTVNLTNYPDGVYVVQITDKEGVILKTNKIVISR